MMENQEKKTLARLAAGLAPGSGPVPVSGLAGAADAYLVSRLAGLKDGPVIVVADSTGVAERFLEDLRFFVGTSKGGAPCLFPDYANFSFTAGTYHNQTAAGRIDILYRLAQKIAPKILVVTLTGLEQRLIPRQVLCDYAELVMVGEQIDPEGLRQKLVAGGYTHTAIVEEPGDFSVRGGILDIFSPFYEDPVRIELFGDLVESVRFFSAVTQRRFRDVQEIIILPAREAILDSERTGAFIAGVKKQGAELDLPLSTIRQVISDIKDGQGQGANALMPLMYDHLSTFFDYLPDTAGIVLLEAADWPACAREQEEKRRQVFTQNREAGRLVMPPERLFLSWPEIQQALSDRAVLQFSTGARPARSGSEGPPDGFHFNVQSNSQIQGLLQNSGRSETPLAPLADWLREKRESRQTCVIAAGGPSRAERIASLLAPYQIQPAPWEHFSHLPPTNQSPALVPAPVSAGFDFPEENLVVISETEIFGRRRRRRGGPAKRPGREQFLKLEELKRGDLVVHVDHGIGQYEGVVNLTVEGVANDFLLIKYKDADRLYLSVDRMDMVKPYIGMEGVEPVLDKMGAKAWGRAKDKAKKEVEKIAKDLLALYARRKVRQGHAFGFNQDLMDDFEAGFPYEETEDQARVIEEVLADMNSEVPMDRLVCGDVGYGKTEVGLRAAFAAVSDAKQVAVMVPTTVLAEQHLATFRERFAEFPINIACLNRFRTPAEQSRIVSAMKNGQVDIVIGTHRLLSADVGFQDLGLVILDEEQRFGVKHKEKLKQMRATVDVLSLTATPIPRTLHMSLMGVRDISIINTPPGNRRAIKTYITEFDDGLIATAIRRELERGGQIYFVHNNIHKIWYIANYLQKLVPEVRLGVAHGRLSREDLENEMMKFVNREIDMLVCTRIIEAGLDIPAANTIFVNRADMFGLSQIYQLRGRVGRSLEQGYAYLFIPRDSALGKEAQKRLKVLMEHNDLGSGFQIAMNDLQIRGGGSALGVSQSGHIAAVGYDMFLQMMEEAVLQLKGEPVIEKLEPEVTMPMSAFISEEYIPDMDQRLAVYRRLARATELKQINAVKDELIDRYGPLPAAAENLLLKIMLKTMAARSAVKKFDISETRLTLVFSEPHLKDPKVIPELVAAHNDLVEVTPGQVVQVDLGGRRERQAVLFAKNILKAVYQRVNN